jgi:pyridinium-3,5-biscarboxylic acid mononucleotide sulfurtransferase
MTKFNQLKTVISEYNSLLVAYSGGVDSSLVLKTAIDVLGDRALAVTAVSPSLPGQELEEAREIARWIGARHVEIESHELEDELYLANTPQRCFFCKNEVYSLLVDYAKENGLQAVADGTNADDQGDHRPGRQAARNLGVRSPLQEVGLTKAEIRELAQELGLPNWDKPAAACLSSRVPYGVPITIQALSQVESAEQVLLNLGFREVRVRSQDHTARIEVSPEDFARLIGHREVILEALKNLGYVYISLDLAGFRSGSSNEALIRHGR